MNKEGAIPYMEIYPMKSYSAKEFGSFLSSSRFTPLREYTANQNLIIEHINGNLAELSSSGGLILLAKDQGKTIGLLSSDRLEWDSTHFGINCFRITHLLASGDYFESLNVKRKLLSNLLAEYADRRPFHISARVYKEDLSSIHALENRSFRLMDVLATYFFNLGEQTMLPLDIEARVRPFRKEETPQLAEIAEDCFANSPVATDRFHADPALPREKSGELYVKWVINSCQDSSSKILVAEQNGYPIGFTIGTVNKTLSSGLHIRLGTIELTAVKPSNRGKRVAESLWSALLNCFQGEVDLVETGVQISNYAVQRALAKIGFKIGKSQCTFQHSEDFVQSCSPTCGS